MNPAFNDSMRCTASMSLLVVRGDSGEADACRVCSPTQWLWHQELLWQQEAGQLSRTAGLPAPSEQAAAGCSPQHGAGSPACQQLTGDAVQDIACIRRQMEQCHLVSPAAVH